MVSVLGVVCVTVALVGLAQADGEGSHRDRDHHARFKVLGPDQQWVLDKTTGLRWQKTPLSWQDGFDTTTDWNTAVGDPDAKILPICTQLVGDGARLPKIKELLSLVDYNDSVNPAHALNAPVGPFTGPTGKDGVLPVDYWSATEFEPENITGCEKKTCAWRVGFRIGGSGRDLKSLSLHVWCVRETRDAD
jgi:hypothetical protein